MTNDQEAASMIAIETCRKINRSAAAKFAERGVTANDIAIAATYSAHDLAMHMGLDGPAAIAWMRTSLDVMEQQLLNGTATLRHVN